MRKVAPHLKLATFTLISNVWLFEDSMNRRILIDTGYLLERPTLFAELWKAGIRRRGDLAAVFLTHRHSDHSSNAAWLKERFGCPVMCHPADAPFLNGDVTAHPMRPGARGLYDKIICQFEDTLPPRVRIDEVFEEGTWKWGFQVLPTPGHTEGSVMLFHEPTKTLFSGDSVLSGLPPVRAAEHLRLAQPSYSQDVDTCKENTKRQLRTLTHVDWIATGHGPLVDTDAAEKLKKLAL